MKKVKSETTSPTPASSPAATQTKPTSCDVNFGKVTNKSVEVFVGTEKKASVEIIGSRGNYSVWTDKSNESLAKLRGKSGSLKEVKTAVSRALCNNQSA